MALDAARSLGDGLRADNDDLVAVVAVVCDGKLNFVVSCGKNAVAAGAHAGKLAMGVASVTGGKGGGRPDSAVAGGNDVSKISEALAEAEKILSSQIG
jgi:alanyl-tRNA synthetase